jgi:stress response protein YsnF
MSGDDAHPAKGREPSAPEARSPSLELEDASVLQLIEERLKIDKRVVVTGRVRVRTVTETIEETIAQDMETSSIEVRRVPKDVILEPGETTGGVRTEGPVTIVPVYEEVLVVEKRLLLKEEVHVIRRTSVETVETPIVLRKQRAIVERLEADGLEQKIAHER